MSMPRIDIWAVSAFNETAQVLETVVIGGRKFEMIHDYWHQHPVIAGRNSVMVISRGEYFPVPASPFRRNSANANVYAAWVRVAYAKYMKD